MNCGLHNLFTSLDETNPLPVPAAGADFLAGELFTCHEPRAHVSYNRAGAKIDAADIAVIAGLYSHAGVDLSLLPKPARLLYEVSIDAFDALVHVWMSELPLEGAAVRFGRGVLRAAKKAGGGIDGGIHARAAASRAANDRGDSDTRLALETAYKVRHEVDRMRGLLRFAPDKNGQYAAYCTPDYFILPALGEHFILRFGETPWTITDEKRDLCLYRAAEKAPALCAGGEFSTPEKKDEWEQLWRQYHKTINNENRNNPELQRQFMPKRYWKHLPEIN